MAGSRECEQYKQVGKVQQYRKVNKGASYAKAVKQVVKCGEVEEMRRREEECAPQLACDLSWLSLLKCYLVSNKPQITQMRENCGVGS